MINNENTTMKGLETELVLNFCRLRSSSRPRGQRFAPLRKLRKVIKASGLFQVAFNTTTAFCQHEQAVHVSWLSGISLYRVKAVVSAS